MHEDFLSPVKLVSENIKQNGSENLLSNFYSLKKMSSSAVSLLKLILLILTFKILRPVRDDKSFNSLFLEPGFSKLRLSYMIVWLLNEFFRRNSSSKKVERTIITLIIRKPTNGKSVILRELITETPMVAKIYAISFVLKFLVLNRRMAKMANNPRPIPTFISTFLSMEQIKKTVIPIRKNVNRNFSFFEYLK